MSLISSSHIVGESSPELRSPPRFASRLARLGAKLRTILQPPLREQVAAIYSQLAAQARDPWYYTEAAVPDTLDGRFDLLVLHLFCFFQGGILPRASLSPTANAASPCSDGAPFKDFPALKRALLELTLDDMDQALREMGVGDMGVSRRIKQMGNAINGRFQAYEAALAEGTLTQALQRNVYGTLPPEAIKPEAVAALAERVMQMLSQPNLKTE